MRIRYSLAMTVAALALAVVVAACGGTTSKIGSGAAVKGQPLKGGTVTVAQISGTSPNDIFPLTPRDQQQRVQPRPDRGGMAQPGLHR